MKLVHWTDNSGLKHRALVRDDDSDEAVVHGIPLDPPNLDRIDWDGIKRELHNALVEHNITTWLDYQRSPIVLNIITSAVKRQLVALYRDSPEGNK